MLPKDYEGINHVVRVDSHTTTKCELCDFFVDEGHPIDKFINHYIKHHGYKILYIGPEGHYDCVTMTVAVLGK